MNEPPQVKLVGILNVTPDSFSDGGKFLDPSKAIEHARQLFADGATLVDVGGESTSPWSSPLSEDKEWERLEPVLKELVKEFPGKILVDTYHPHTAQRALQMGVTYINDVTMFRDPDMVNLALEYRDKARYVMSHLPLDASSIADAHKRMPAKTVQDVKGELLFKRQVLIYRGIPAQNIILDPGIGFGKTPDLNPKLITFAKEVPGIEVMIGYSRKRFLGNQRMEIEPNLAAGKSAMASGAAYLRVHDVAAHKQGLGL